MKIAILGTRGIPNQYGGFEQLAEHLSLGLISKGHEVYVYSSSNHTYREKVYRGIHLIHKYDPEKKIGTAGQFVYDLNCILDSRKRRFDVILNLGYTSSAVWLRLARQRTKIVTNMDGLEWKRTKYSRPVQQFLRHSEKLAVKLSDVLIADSLAIQRYLADKYNAPSHFVAYGANIIDDADISVLLHYGLRAGEYNMLIARMEPENNIDMILNGVRSGSTDTPFIVIGNIKNRYGRFLKTKYEGCPKIRFVGPEYDVNRINSLRFFCRMYFHGHSVGGTNPSLLEAMGNRCLIAAHRNVFNESVLGNDAFYFSSPSDVTEILSLRKNPSDDDIRIRNVEKIRANYSWPLIVNNYEKVLVGAID